MKFLSFYFLIFLFGCTIQNQDEKLILDFVISCKDKKANPELLRNKYFCKSKNTKVNQGALNKFIEDQISELCNEMQSQDLAALKLSRADEDPEVKKEFLNEDFSKVFILKAGQKNVRYFLINNGKIASFIVMNKGGIKSFMPLCN
ncbi:hypothetical protein [Flavobacterium sp. FlaQc-48]|uniref:hypothetical protein n=1 Tax=Flavobacterium sp. FlaQc-48 TaxID=3374181 RepID=UPI003756D865